MFSEPFHFPYLAKWFLRQSQSQFLNLCHPSCVPPEILFFARGIMFLTCVSICACVHVCGQGHSPVGLLPTSSLHFEWPHSHSGGKRLLGPMRTKSSVVTCTVSVCLSHLLTAACRCGGFAAVGPAGRRHRSIAAAASHCSSMMHTAWHSSANASSVM